MRPLAIAVCLCLPAALCAQTCRITIHQVSSKGEKSEIIFETALRSRQECEALAKMHQPNFDPAGVRRKQVSFLWR
jgi:hypothetical protein